MCSGRSSTTYQTKLLPHLLESRSKAMQTTNMKNSEIKQTKRSLLVTWFGLLSDLENGGSTFLLNVHDLKNCINSKSVNYLHSRASVAHGQWLKWLHAWAWIAHNQGLKRLVSDVIIEDISRQAIEISLATVSKLDLLSIVPSVQRKPRAICHELKLSELEAVQYPSCVEVLLGWI
jgi:hypothetical protein